jgi:hypothetical protein
MANLFQGLWDFYSMDCGKLTFFCATRKGLQEGYFIYRGNNPPVKFVQPKGLPLFVEIALSTRGCHWFSFIDDFYETLQCK